MQDVAADILRILDDTLPRFAAFSEADAASVRPGGAWTRKQILGHLVDSAANNHQRFVRAQLQDELVFPSYEQEGWVAVQAYSERPWPSLVALWEALNRHVAHVIARIPRERLARPVRLGEHAPMTLEFVARDYVRHLRHHLEQILEPEQAAGKKF